MELPFNSEGYDPYGISREHLGTFYTVLSVAYRRYFRVRTFGVHNVPMRGRAMIVGNHSGGVAIDAAMVLAACFLEMEPPRLAHSMAERFLNQMPIASLWTSRVGQFTGLPEHALRLLEDDRLLMVYPEGARGTAKLYHERHSLIGFGTGFMRLAMQTHTPIIPCAFVGGGEVLPTIRNLYGLGHMLGVPYIPLTPWILPVPLPRSCEIYFGRPMVFEGSGHEDDEHIDARVERVKARVGALLNAGVDRHQQGRRDAPWDETAEGGP
jgi:1-acyl-sn-glycerol-3-phosphate acyltransferase